MKKILILLTVCLIMLTGCDIPIIGSIIGQETSGVPVSELVVPLPDEQASFDYSEIPPFSGSPYTVVNNNIPYFSEKDITDRSFEYYSELDGLGRCGVTFSCVGKDIMPTEKRESIGMIKPTGWHMDKYDFVDGKYLYNRCHLQGYQLTGENRNERNLITGTRYLNTQGMLPFENEVTTYVKLYDNHVLYRVTPVFIGDELVARGVLMEAYSVEDTGVGVCFNVFCYNVCPGVTIDYLTGDSHEDGSIQEETSEIWTSPVQTQEITEEQSASETVEYDFVLNTRSMKIHLPDCKSVKDISENNREFYSGSIDELLEQGYAPCGSCHPEQ